MMSRINWHPPVAAYGKSSQTTLSSSAAAGATVLPLDNSGGAFAVGDQVFVSEAGGGELQYLGPVVVAGSSSITVTYPLQLAKLSSAIAWHATQFMAFEQGSTACYAEHDSEEGVTIDVSRGGAVSATRIGEAVAKLRLSFGAALATDFVAYRAWVRTLRGGGVHSFSLAYYDETAGASVVHEVRDAMTGFSAQRRMNEHVTFERQFFIVNEGTYVLA